MKPIIFISLYFLSLSVFAQSWRYEGTIVDDKTGEPVPFAHINIADKPAEGYITDFKGRYEFLADRLEVPLNISCVGYEGKKVTLKKGLTTQITLMPVLRQLNEVVISSEDPAKVLLRKVVEKIPDNYPNQQERLTATITEYAFKDSSYNEPHYKATATIQTDKWSYQKANAIENATIRGGKNIIYDNSMNRELKIYALLTVFTGTMW